MQAFLLAGCPTSPQTLPTRNQFRAERRNVRLPHGHVLSRADSLSKNSALHFRRHRRSSQAVIDDGLETSAKPRTHYLSQQGNEIPLERKPCVGVFTMPSVRQTSPSGFITISSKAAHGVTPLQESGSCSQGSSMMLQNKCRYQRSLNCFGPMWISQEHASSMCELRAP